jgi:hypothetical protein
MCVSVHPGDRRQRHGIICNRAGAMPDCSARLPGVLKPACVVGLAA